jgi:hypothetical protein
VQCSPRHCCSCFLQCKSSLMVVVFLHGGGNRLIKVSNYLAGVRIRQRAWCPAFAPGVLVQRPSAPPILARLPPSARSYALDAERKMGQMLIEAPKAKGTQGQLVGRGVIGGNKSEPPIKPTPTLRDIGLTKRDSSQAQKLARLPASAHARACAAACIPHAQGRAHAPGGIRTSPQHVPQSCAVPVRHSSVFQR